MISEEQMEYLESIASSDSKFGETMMYSIIEGIEALQKDRARLDWLQFGKKEVVHILSDRHCEGYFVIKSSNGASHKSLRNTIDAAMAGK